MCAYSLGTLICWGRRGEEDVSRGRGGGEEEVEKGKVGRRKRRRFGGRGGG